MKKRLNLLAVLLLPCMAFAQSKLPFFSEKPFNKGNMVLNIGYEKQPSNCSRGEAPKICLNAGYGFSDWCVAGLYVDFGKSMGGSTCFVSDKDETGQWVHIYSLDYRSNYLAYGVQAQLHPLAPLLPGFYLFDVYAVARAGMHHFICGVISEEGEDPFQETKVGSLKNAGSPYLAGGWGVSVNPSKYFGLFYEGTYNTLTDIYPISTGSINNHLYHRFGFNIRFGGPKKWQNTKQ